MTGSDPRANLYGMSLPGLERITELESQPRYRARQIAEWLYHHDASEVDAMTNLPAPTRADWRDRYRIATVQHQHAGTSGDGTQKHLWDAFGGDVYETALIPEASRLTLCVSSQAGCRIGCKFCLTARKGLKQSLSAAEILSQYRNLPDRDRVTHIVFMGMGEPLDNADAVIDAVSVLTSDWGYGLSPRRITVSTVGILPELERLLDETDVNVAISLHAARREERLPIVPSENRYPIANIVALLRDRARLALAPFASTGRRRLSFEITMIDGITDRQDQAAAVRDLISGIPSRVNLIPWNPFPGTQFRPSERAAIETYQALLKRAGIMTTVRESRGQDIGAACGLLAGRRESRVD